MARATMIRAETLEEISPLIDLCKAGRLFEVQAWIKVGRPVNLPPYSGRGVRKKSPLIYAIDSGFHSLVKVLLDGGADVDDGCPMCRALEKRRLDLVQLLVEHGYDPKTVDMSDVFATWDPEIMEYFIDLGADLETDMPLAWALCNRIRTALRIFKKYHEAIPCLNEQCNVALRHHCRDGNMKWVSLLLWAGADPLAPGECEPCAPRAADDEGLSALGFAALYGKYEVFDLKKVDPPPDHPAMREALRYCGCGRGIELLERLLKKGVDPNDQENGGCSKIQNFLQQIGWESTLYASRWEQKDSGVDSERSRDCIKATHLLAEHGGRWAPVDAQEINAARRALLKATPDHTVEFVWIMSKYGACSRADIEVLLRTPTIKRHTAKQRQRLTELLRAWAPQEPSR